jgi:cellulose synthase/poly-beta-1,6-N-acetylglucosamine synthase-like glycosyltransferase
VRPAPPPPDEWPSVTVQLPLFNERCVADRLIKAVARLDYPRDRLQIQVLDDSTDDTLQATRRLAERLRTAGFDVQHLHRDDRRGYKAGALAAGLVRARGELVAIFDADFVPPRGFLRRIVPYVLQPGVGVAQARWGHLNRNAAWFTRLQAILLDGHFVIEQSARAWNGYFLSFNGTCGVWRRRAIEESGGWTSDTVTEDLDLSFRAQLAGWRIEYVPDLVVPGELPAEPNAFRSQQRRWTKGGVQVARKLLPAIRRAPIPRRVKIEAFLHLTCYAAYPLLLLLALLRTPARLFAPETTLLGLLPGEIELLLIGTLPLLVFYALAQGGSFRAWWRYTLPAMALGAGLAVSNTLAVLAGLWSRDLTFHRTPKRGDPAAALLRTYRAPAGWVPCAELALVIYIVLWKLLGTGLGVLADLPLVIFFGYGLLALGVPSLRMAASGGRARHPSPAPM